MTTPTPLPRHDGSEPDEPVLDREAATPRRDEQDAVREVARMRRKALSPHVDEVLLWATEPRDPQEIPHFTDVRVTSIVFH